jgi:hypothetical protein
MNDTSHVTLYCQSFADRTPLQVLGKTVGALHTWLVLLPASAPIAAQTAAAIDSVQHISWTRHLKRRPCRAHYIVRAL